MATELLNLDLLIPEDKFITFRGEKHPVTPLSAKHYLTLSRERKRWANEPEDYVNTRQSIDLLALAIPTIGLEVLENLPLPAVMALARAVEQATEDMAGEPAKDTEGKSTSPSPSQE